VRFFGSKFHDTSTAMITGNAEDILLEGVEIWNLSDMGLDPNDVTHPDVIGAVAGNTLRFTLTDSWVRGRIMFIDQSGGNGGPHRDLLFQRLWVSDSPSSGFTFTSAKSSPPYGIFGARRDIWSWGHNNGKDRIDILSGQHLYTGNTRPDRINVIDSGVHASAPPAGMASPPARWRAAHPYSSWVAALDGV
jgi:hypothetical protein